MTRIQKREFRIQNLALLILSASVAVQAQETTQAKIARALSAAPADIAKSARVVDKDAQGKMIVLREGTNGFTCMPGDPKVIGDPAMCSDAASMQWAADFKAHKPKPSSDSKPLRYDHPARSHVTRGISITPRKAKIAV
jgi:hypothetical protein